MHAKIVSRSRFWRAQNLSAAPEGIVVVTVQYRCVRYVVLALS